MGEINKYVYIYEISNENEDCFFACSFFSDTKKILIDKQKNNS